MFCVVLSLEVGAEDGNKVLDLGDWSDLYPEDAKSESSAKVQDGNGDKMSDKDKEDLGPKGHLYLPQDYNKFEIPNGGTHTHPLLIFYFFKSNKQFTPNRKYRVIHR